MWVPRARAGARLSMFRFSITNIFLYTPQHEEILYFIVHLNE